VVVGIALVRLVAARLAAPVAHDDLVDHRREQISTEGGPESNGAAASAASVMRR
jgi:hypothetical protein